MRQSLRQLFLSTVLSVTGSFALMLLLAVIGMKPSEGSDLQAGALLFSVILVLFYGHNSLSKMLANRHFEDFSFESIFSGPREEGTVKWFNATKGFGFITRDDDGEDVFVHYRSIRGRNRYLLRDGATVSYVLGQSGKGPQAEDVDLVE